MGARLISTRDPQRKEISYSDALLQGLAPDGGLYIPTEYLEISPTELADFRGKPYTDLAFKVKSKLVDTPSAELHSQVNRAYAQDKFGFIGSNIVPVRKIGEGFFVEELSHGPTASFKDMALRQLAQEIEHALERRGESLNMLGGTSGDTGSSAEDAFKESMRVKLCMLSPQLGMSAFQKDQMGVLSGGNILNASLVGGTFDDCQYLVKQLKGEPEFAKLGAVNSINWGRISSQVPYYVSGYVQVAERIGNGAKVDFVVPSGNFGNVFAGYVARRMGVPIRRLIIATNENDVLERLVRTGVYEKKGKADRTSSPSMDITDASNYERLLFEMVGRNPDVAARYMLAFKRTGKVDLADFGLSPTVFAEFGFFAGSSSHAKRIEEIRRVSRESGIVIDPHTADGVSVARKYVNQGAPVIVMSTAMPVKFEDTIKEALGHELVPEREERFRGLEARVPKGAFYEIKAGDAEALREYLRRNMN